MKTYARTILLAASFLALGIANAQAGFQWSPPSQGSFTPSSPNAGNQVTIHREMPPRPAAAPVTPVMSEALPASVADINAGNPIRTMPDGPANAAPIYGGGMTNDPITWNQNHNTTTTTTTTTPVAMPRAPQSIMPAEAVPLTPVAANSIMAPAPMAPNTMIQQTTVTSPMSTGQYAVAQGFGRDLPLVMAIRQIVPPSYGFVFDQGIDVQSHVSWQGGQPWDIVLQNTLSPMGMTATINGNVISIARNAAMPGVQMAAAQGMIPAGPQVVTDTVRSTTTTTMTAAPVATMTATPVAMTSPTPFVASDDMGMGTGYTNARAVRQTDLNSSSTWVAPRNSTLRSILEDWSQRVGVELYWASEYDYPIQSAVSLQGTFEDAVQTLLKGLSESKPRPMGRLHPNLPNGPAVLVIETRQNSM